MYKNIFYPITFRKYQIEILKNFEKKYKTNEKKFHFVAPPGAGKTIVGLELIRLIGKKACVFSPNSTIQMQWIEKLNNLTNEISISNEAYKNTDIITLTYQSITVKDKNTNKLHENAIKLIKHIKDNYEVIILDECHHLVAFWAEIIKDIISNDKIVIGLTATPPIDKSQREINSYLDIVGEVDYQIPLPAVIKENNLAPFQDLLYITEPSSNELEILKASNDKFKKILNKLLNLNKPLIPIHIWIYQRLEEYRDKDENLIPFTKLFLLKPDYCIAAAKLTLKEMNDLPKNVFLYEEMEEELTINDIILILEDYILKYINNSNDTNELYDEIKEALKDIGYTLTKNGIRTENKSPSTNLISLSENKMIAMKKILKKELENMQDDLRCLILTDYDKGKYLDGTTATSTMKYITSDEEVDGADPILVTGSTVLVDDDLLELFSIKCK